MKKYILSILVVSILLIGGTFIVKSALAANLNMRGFINLLISIGVIPTDKVSNANNFLTTLEKTPGKCGDGICDTKEQSNSKLCPTDCTTNVVTPPASPSPVVPTINLQTPGAISPFGIMAAFESSTLTKINVQDKFAWAGERFRDVGAKWSKTGGADFSWDLMEPVLGNGYDFSKPDEALKESYENGGTGYNTVLVMHSTRAKGANPDLTSANEQYFKNFVKTAVERYDGDGIGDAPGNIRVKYWQADNEPFPRKWEEAGGSVDGYIRFLELFNEAVKEADPEAKIILGTFQLETPEAVAKFREVIAKTKDKNLFDYVDTHFWARADNYKISINEARSILDSNGYSNVKFVALEFGTWAETRDATQKDQANYVVKGYVYNLAQGFVLINWNNLVEWASYGGKDPNSIFNFMGLIVDGQNGDSSSAGTPRLSYYSYKLMTEKLAGFSSIQTIPASGDVNVYKFVKNGVPVWVAWTDSGQSQSVTLNGLNSASVKITQSVPKFDSGKEVTDYATAFNSEIKTVNNGQVTLTLSGVPVFVETSSGGGTATTTPTCVSNSDCGVVVCKKAPCPQLVCLLGSCVSSATTTPPLTNIPKYVITIHVNPVNIANPGSAAANNTLLGFYNNTKSEVEYANKYNIKLSLWISALMADYISNDPVKLAEVKTWMQQGHEIGLHHHSLYRDTDWDGYTFMSKAEALAVRRSLNDYKDNYKGTTADMIAIIKKINPNVKSGVNSEQDHREESMPNEIIYSTGSGYLNYGTPGVFSESDKDVAVAVNEFISTAVVSGIERKWLRHYDIGTRENVLAAQTKFNSTSPSYVFSVMTHNSESNIMAVKSFMDFLHTKDSTGTNSRTVSQVMESNTLPEKEIGSNPPIFSKDKFKLTQTTGKYSQLDGICKANYGTNWEFATITDADEDYIMTANNGKPIFASTLANYGFAIKNIPSNNAPFQWVDVCDVEKDYTGDWPESAKMAMFEIYGNKPWPHCYSDVPRESAPYTGLCKNVGTTDNGGSYTLIKDIEYKNIFGSSIKLDLYKPNTAPLKSSGYPVIMEIHGGGFIEGDKYPSNWAEILTAKGYVVASINYRLSGNGKNIFPAAVQDIKAAVRWLRAHASEYDLDINNFGAIGASAGGSLVAFLGVSGNTTEFDVGDNLNFSSGVKAVVDQYGPTNFSIIAADRIAGGLNSNADVLDYTGCSNNCENNANAIKASPVTYINSGDAAFLIMHGTVDKTIPIKQSEDFYNSLRRAGLDTKFLHIQGAGHGDNAVNRLPNADKFSAHQLDVIIFFDRFLKR